MYTADVAIVCILYNNVTMLVYMYIHMSLQSDFNVSYFSNSQTSRPLKL